MRETTIMPPEDEAALRALVELHESEELAGLVLGDGTRIRLPDEVAQALRGIVEALAGGKAVTVAPQHTTLTTQQAADLLGVSRPTLVKLLEEGNIPHTRPGRHRRVRLSDVLAYRDAIRDSREALDELADVSEEAGLYQETAAPKRTR